MAYLVKITARAGRDFARLYGEINAQDSDAALHWCQELKTAILSLEKGPNRCPMAPEKANLRHLLYGHKPYIYRVIFRVVEKSKQVDVLHLRRCARRKFRASGVD